MNQPPTWEVRNQDCRQIPLELPKASVDVTITSPPYKESDGFSFQLMGSFESGLRHCMKPGGLLFLNFAHLAERWGRPFEVFHLFERSDWIPLTTIIWVKSMVFPPLEGWSDVPRQVGRYQPLNTPWQPNNLFEYIFVFAHQQALRPLDRLAPPNGVPFSDKANLTRGTRGKNGDRHCGGNVWFVPYPTGSKLHPYEFPVEIPERCLALAGATSDDLVLDPFAGSGTVLVASKHRGIAAVGYERDAGTARIATERLERVPVSANP
jgi:hypothetical protein